MLKIVESRGQAISLSKTNKIVTGFLVGVETGVGKFDSNIYHLRQTNGKVVKVWGNFTMDALFVDGKKLAKEYAGCFVQMTWKRRVKTGSGNMFNEVEIAVDSEKRVKLTQKQGKKVPF